MVRICVIGLIATMALAGCNRSTKLTQANYDKIVPGMTLAEVEAILGPGEPEGGSLDISEGSGVAGAAGIGGDLQSMSAPRNPIHTYKWGSDKRWIRVNFLQGKVAQANPKSSEGLN